MRFDVNHRKKMDEFLGVNRCGLASLLRWSNAGSDVESADVPYFCCVDATLGPLQLRTYTDLSGTTNDTASCKSRSTRSFNCQGMAENRYSEECSNSSAMFS